MATIMATSAEYRVPRLMWESLEASLNIAGKNYVRHLAAVLEVPEKELIKEVFRQNKVSVCIHDWTESDIMCSATVIQGVIKQPCPHAKVCGSEFCSYHSSKHVTVENDGLQLVSRIACDGIEMQKDCWKRDDNCIIDSKGKIIGYIKDEVAYLIEK
jgi:hypothetical protein